MTESSKNVGAGQQDPFTSNSDVEVTMFIVRQLLAQVDTMKLVRVAAVHAGTGSPPRAGTVDVDVLLSQVDGAGNATPSGKVFGLPIWRLQGGPWSVVVDPAVGDVGLAVVADRDISGLKSAAMADQNPLVPPGSRRRNSVADGVYLGGCLNRSSDASVWLKGNGTLAFADSLGNVLETTAGGFAATTAGGGDFTVNGISVLHHTHEVVGVSAGGATIPSGPPV